MSDQFKHSGSHTILVMERRQYRKFDIKNDHQTKRNSTSQNHSIKFYDKAQRYYKTLSKYSYDASSKKMAFLLDSERHFKIIGRKVKLILGIKRYLQT